MQNIMTVDITTGLKFILKEGYAFIQTPHQTLLLKPKRHELSAYYVVFLCRMLDHEYKTLQDVIDSCNNKIEITNIDKVTYAAYLNSSLSDL